ncbi:MAG TPA: hypothetical protein VH643_34470 [Gemmataceae bacterium]|jgi:hypothetical protein
MIPRRITLFLSIALACLTFAVGLAAVPLKREGIVKRATDASRASTETIRSGTGVVAFESYVQEPEEKESRLWAKGTVKVYFKDEKYHFRFNYETKRIRTTYLDRQGKKKEEKIAEWKPDDLAIICDGTKVQVVTFTKRIRPAGCRVEIYDNLVNTPTVVKGDLTRIWLQHVGLDRIVKTMKQDTIQITDLSGGDYRLSYEHKEKPKDRIEIDVSSDAKYNPTRYRMLLPGWDDAHEECSAKWKTVGDVWYVTELVMTSRYRYSDKPTYRMERSRYRYETFEPNAKVDAQLFTLDCLKIPPETRTMDRRPREKR